MRSFSPLDAFAWTEVLNGVLRSDVSRVRGPVLCADPYL